MNKPTNTKLTDVDSAEKLEALEHAVWSISGAMDALRGIRDCAGWFDALGDLFDEIESDREMYAEIVSAEDEREEEMLSRDYVRSVL